MAHVGEESVPEGTSDQAPVRGLCGSLRGG